MDKFLPFTIHDLAKVTNHRSGEIKFGEKMLTVPAGVNPLNFLKNSEAKYVLFGIPEDIGIRANYGRPGAASAWNEAIKSIANIQHNRFCKGNQIIVMGQINVAEEMAEVENLDFNKIDDRVKLSQLVKKLIKMFHTSFSISSN